MERIIDLLLTLLPGSILLLQTLIGKIMLANNLTLSRNASEKAMAPHSSTLAWKIHGQRSLVGYSPWGREESDRTEWLHFHFSLSYIEKEMATHSSVLAWRIPGTGKPGELPSIGLHRIGHNWSDLAAAAGMLTWNYMLFFPMLFFKILVLYWNIIHWNIIQQKHDLFFKKSKSDDSPK